MAQATGVQNFVNAKVWYSLDGTTWVPISGYCAGVSIGGGGRITGQGYTFDGEVAITGVGKRQPVEVTVNLAYTEGASEPYKEARDAYEANDPYYLRWSPEGDLVGTLVYSTDDDSRITNEPLPVGTAASADPNFVEITVRTREVLVSSAT